MVLEIALQGSDVRVKVADGCEFDGIDRSFARRHGGGDGGFCGCPGCLVGEQEPGLPAFGRLCALRLAELAHCVGGLIEQGERTASSPIGLRPLLEDWRNLDDHCQSISAQIGGIQLSGVEYAVDKKRSGHSLVWRSSNFASAASAFSQRSVSAIMTAALSQPSPVRKSGFASAWLSSQA